ncbi:ABC-2 family transporter protein [Streptomyces sp. LP11]|uniref:ABC-2 family transporter protein n=1 Tax=Streptomyces pyxinicus TaxID=2970331 RepID=A0ABT2B1S8_9ACTN|nr:ABC-2 family transporter protein [Streptomyces sp. LP11]MCS0602469.1 ABC-2 family transporter protein [Streptomyces sp. LP11]
MGAGRLYVAVAVGGFRRYATYRAATAAGVFTNTVFGLILVSTYRALWDERPHLGGWDQSQVVTYVWLGQAFLSTLAIGGGGVEGELMERIRTGDVAIDLYRPADLQLWWLAADLGRGFFQFLGRGLVPFVFGALCFPVYLPADAGTWLAFLVAVLLAMLVGFGIRYLLALSAFWLLDGTGVTQISWLAGYFCSGMLLPLNVFPGALGEVVRALPWSALLQAPAEILLDDADPFGTYLFQGAWAVLLLGAGRLLQSAATRRVVVQGG